MATPNPKSRSQILGGMINSFLARLGLPSIKTGDPSLSILEAASQSDFRNTQEILNLLAQKNRKNRRGAALDADGRDEKVPRIAESPADGAVTLGDSAFSKVETRIYQGGTGLVSGTVTLVVEDASSFPASGSLYLGRGTVNSEGPLAYASAPVSSGSYWTITLSSPVQNYHQLGESVVLAQGGDRLIPAGTVISTPTNSAGGQVQFRTLFDAIIPDGEIEVTKVPVLALTPGISGNVSAGAIDSFTSKPFATATVTNPLPFSTGTPTEDDDTYRERIETAVAGRSKAVKAAIVSGLLGARSVDEDGKISSVSLYARAGEPKTLYIDNGSGYEEKVGGVILETLCSSAIGGEQFFGLSNRPVAKAFVQSSNGPFVAVPGTSLTVRVGGIPSIHTFSANDFRNADSASAYEVTASINANFSLPFGARTVGTGTAVAIYAKKESQEDIQVEQTSANSWLNFADQRVFTLYLYRNDVLLSEDGFEASVRSRNQSDWGAIVSGATLTLSVDGIAQSITVSDADFVSANTEYATVAEFNSLQAWAAVLNSKIAGATATVEGAKLAITSNLGRNSRASVSITGGTIAAAIFDESPSSVGVNSDYVLDRNSAQIKLTSPLLAGDKLVAGSASTRAFLETDVGTLVISAASTSVPAESGAELWFVVDGAPETIQTNIGTGTSLTWAVASSPAWGDRVSVSCASPVWANAKAGDWLIVTDAAVTQGARGAFRVARVASTSSIQIERASGSPTGTFILTSGGVKLIRTAKAPQRVYVPAGSSYTPTSLSAILNSALVGATAAPYATTKLRLRTDFSTGDISVVAANGAGLSLFPLSTKTSTTSHTATVEASNSQVGIPNFTTSSVSAVGSSTQITVGATASSYVLANFLKPLSEGSSSDRYSNAGEVRSIENQSGTYDLTLRPAATKEWLVGNRLFYSRGYDLTARDNLSLVVDGDNLTGRYTVDVFRKAKIVALSGTMELSEVGGASLAAAFGTSFDWRDFRVDFKSRTKSHSSPDTDKTILWRWWRHGAEGDNAQMQYQYPNAANTDVSVETSDVNDVVVRLQSGAPRTVSSFRNTAKIGMAITSLAAGLYTYQYVANLAVSGATRTTRINFTGQTGGSFTAGACTIGGGATANIVTDGGTYIVITGLVGLVSSGMAIVQGGVSATTTSGSYGYTTLTLTLPGAVTNHGLAVGNTVYVNSTDVNFPSASRTVAAIAPTTISYIDTLSTAATGGAIGSVSNDLSGEVTVGAPVVTGDIFSGAAMAVPSVYRKAVKITLSASGRDWSGVHFKGVAPATTLVWYPVIGASFYPLTANTAAQIATKVNAIANCSVSAAAVGTAGVATATGTPLNATYEASELGGTSPWYQFSDGFNWVRSTNTPANTTANFIFTLRNAIASNLTTNADLPNEDVRLVPVTASSVSRWLSSTAVSGLGARGASFDVENGKVQIETSTLGSSGSIRIVGGGANVGGTSVRGSASIVGSTTKMTVDATDTLGGLQYVWVQNTLPNEKAVFDSSTIVNSVTAAGEVALDNGGTKAWTQVQPLTDNTAVMIERQGSLVHLKGTAPTIGTNTFATLGVFEGDWVRIQASTTPPAGTVNASLQNLGVFRVIRAGTNEIWIENDNAVEELASIKYDFIAYNSVMPGDLVSFGDTALGDNVGVRRVTALGATEWEFVLDTSELALQPVTSPVALTSNSDLYRVQTSPSRMLKQVTAIAPNGSTHMDLIVDTWPGATLISEAYGTNLIVANKLSFGAVSTSGVDGYRPNTGLIAEANRIVFGDETDTATYEGVASAGNSYNIAGPMIKRIKVALAVRTYTGVSAQSVKQRVQSSVAAAINKSGVGKSIAISSLVEAASVNGVEAVTVLSPVYGAGDDLIVLAPYEKAWVADIEADISVSFVGE